MMAISIILMGAQIFAYLSLDGLGKMAHSLRGAGMVSGSELGRSVMMGMRKEAMDAARIVWL